ncbi:zinc finger MYND domain-containing protein [Phanerochaete sordida]|uniref:Zinc finger MYND domain-containing protein n=1 Tax=Phanerochaete sordida TaxID=48140 RepID=A0A9P3FYJ6_9APHY|nr:zinc finger MYND domain-containing protein [Phanerochaete sordida]
MRESNFAFPAQSRACVCITSQLYDRRALDTNVPLPLYNSLSHLTYLTSTSPRIREIMTMDGGLERLVRILHEFCLCPPPPQNDAILYGLSSPTAHPPKLVPTLNPKSYDKQAAYRFSLAFQSVVNIGVRGSEQIRGRVVQAGTLEVVGCILEAWLASKGFAVGPSTSAGGMHRESREQRLARRAAQAELKQREQAAALARALQRQVAAADRTIRAERTVQTPEEDLMDVEPSTSGRRPSSRDTDTSTEPSSNTTPAGSNTPTGSVIVPAQARDRSGTIIARPVWDQTSTQATGGHHRGRTLRARPSVAPASDVPTASHSTDNSRPDTETEDDGDIDMDVTRDSDAPVSGASSPERRNPSPDASTVRDTATHPRRAVGIVSDTVPPAAGASLDMNTDAHIIISDQAVPVDGVDVADGIVSLETNDDFAMGAPPGERTPRAGTITLPMTTPTQIPPLPATARARATEAGGTTERARGTQTPNGRTAATTGSHHHHHHRDSDSGPYRDEDVLLALQLLAYLSKYPHVRQAFYKQRPSFHPATLQQDPNNNEDWWKNQASSSSNKQATAPAPAKETNAFMKAFNSATGRGKEKEKEKATATPGISPASSSSSTVVGSSTPQPRMTNVFSLVERFTYRPSSSELEGPNPPPTLPPEIQYWAGVIMRNACRKDDQQGGIRQCANMMCGKWESFPREFAKCRRCRKAKYCGKECQSIAWSEGHRFWCSAKDNDDDADRENNGESSRAGGSGSASASANRAERRAAREQERAARLEARVVEEFGEARAPTRTVAVPEAIAAAAVTATPPANGDATRQRAGGGNWSFSPLTIRRPRMRADDGAANPNEPQDARTISIRYRGANGTTTVPVNAAADMDLPPDVRQHLQQLLQGQRGEDQQRANSPANAASGEGTSVSGDNGDDPMVIG